MDDIKNVPGWGIPEDFNEMLNNRSGNQRTSYDEIQDVLDDLADDISQAVTERKWKDLLIYLVEALERKSKDKGEFNQLLSELVEYLSKRID
jgi:hypothetical protein